MKPKDSRMTSKPDTFNIEPLLNGITQLLRVLWTVDAICDAPYGKSHSRSFCRLSNKVRVLTSDKGVRVSEKREPTRPLQLQQTDFDLMSFITQILDLLLALLGY